jgi:hypothetical protein
MQGRYSHDFTKKSSKRNVEKAAHFVEKAACIPTIIKISAVGKVEAE